MSLIDENNVTKEPRRPVRLAKRPDETFTDYAFRRKRARRAKESCVLTLAALAVLLIVAIVAGVLG